MFPGSSMSDVYVFDILRTISVNFAIRYGNIAHTLVINNKVPKQSSSSKILKVEINSYWNQREIYLGSIT